MNKNLEVKLQLCTKSEIIDQIIKVSEYLLNHKLGLMVKSRNTWNTYKKDDLIDIYMKMLDVISADLRADMCQRATKDPEAVPELKKLALECNAKTDIIRAQMKETCDGYRSRITNIIKEWLGNDLKYIISNSCIAINIPGNHHLNIDIYYRENHKWDPINHKTITTQGAIEINQPTFGTWNPNQPEDKDAVRFFEILYKLAMNENNILESIRECMDKNHACVYDHYNEINTIHKEYDKKMTAVADEVVMNMKF